MNEHEAVDLSADSPPSAKRARQLDNVRIHLPHNIFHVLLSLVTLSNPHKVHFTAPFPLSLIAEYDFVVTMSPRCTSGARARTGTVALLLSSPRECPLRVYDSDLVTYTQSRCQYLTPIYIFGYIEPQRRPLTPDLTATPRPRNRNEPRAVFPAFCVFQCFDHSN